MFNRFVFNKKNIFGTYKGHSLVEILSYDIAYLSYGYKSSFFKRIIKAFVARDIVPPDRDAKILFSIGPYGDRKEQLEIIDFVISQVGISYFFNINATKYKLWFPNKGIMLALKIAFSKALDFSFSQRVSLCCMILHYMNTIDLLHKSSSQLAYKKFCSFCSALPFECILDQFFRYKGIETFTLQHGVYAYTSTPPLDAIVLVNMVSDNLLCWGDYTKNEFIRYGVSADKIHVAGYPRIVKGFSPYRINQDCRIIFLCSRKIYEHQNTEIMKIIAACQKKLSANVSVKIHPSLDRDKYLTLCEEYGFSLYEKGTIKDVIESGTVDIVVTYNSSAYYDAYVSGRYALKYIDDNNEISFNISDDTFSNKQDFMEKVGRIINSSDDLLSANEITRQLEIAIGYNINNYNKLLCMKGVE